MSYYILPKINNTINVNPIDSSNNVLTYTSHSLLNYYNEITHQIKRITLNDSDFSFNVFDELIKIVNPYEYVFSNVPGSKFSVSKLKPNSTLFYEFFEASIILNIFDSFKPAPIKSLHITSKSNDTIECFQMMRENFNDNIISFNEINDETIKSLNDIRFDFIFFEAKTNSGLREYIISLIEILLIIFRNQDKNGTCVIKISHIFHKPVVDVLYILSSIYDKIYVLKTNTSNITTFDKFIVCKNFTLNEEKNRHFRFNYFKLIIFLKKLQTQHNIISILDFEIPYYFTMKINDLNIIIGQQQLETLNTLISILKNKNKDDKIETLKKTNIQKSVSWCEKYKIPCNKFAEKINIFLPVTNDSNEFNETDLN
jgi:hypothetical protein